VLSPKANQNREAGLHRP